MTCSPAFTAVTNWRAPGDAGVVYLLRLQPDAQYRVGGIGMRYRLYSRLGLPGSLLRGFSRSVLPPTGWAIFYCRDYLYRRRGGVAGSLVCRSTTLRILGIGLLMIIAVYLWFALSRSTAI